MFIKSSILLPLATLSFPASAALTCSPASIPKPDILGASIIDVHANEAHNYTSVSIGPGSNDGGKYTISFCNVTVVYTHPGWNDTIHTQVWLPLENWNGRFQAIGGGGYSTGFGSVYLTYAVAQGFAAASTDGGVPGDSGDSGAVTIVATDLSWALSSRNNVNWLLMHNYASKATKDMADIGKQIIKAYYRRGARYSYFSGCSGGGRQAFSMAQQFPDAFDGILAVAPAINLETFIPAGYWPTLIMDQTRTYPSPAELDGFVSAAVSACDGLDGVHDNIISLPHLCNVTAFDFIGQRYTSNGIQHTLTASSARVVQAAWSGSGKAGYPGVNKDAPLTPYYIPTTCSADNTTCHSTGSPLFGNWISYLLAKDPDFSPAGISQAEFFRFLRVSKTDYGSMLATSNPDLSGFRSHGGKMITWHGLADEVIPPEGLARYYNRVLDLDPHAHDFFRFFQAPGVGHCHGGSGPVPNGALKQLIDWVERGAAPDTLRATRGVNITSRDLCPYPLQQSYIGGDPGRAESFGCA
ncbi:Tannase/feruloyl esterase [Aspergillus crustosus]